VFASAQRRVPRFQVVDKAANVNEFSAEKLGGWRHVAGSAEREHLPAAPSPRTGRTCAHHEGDGPGLHRCRRDLAEAEEARAAAKARDFLAFVGAAGGGANCLVMITANRDLIEHLRCNRAGRGKYRRRFTGAGKRQPVRGVRAHLHGLAHVHRDRL
jgi:hypothetical protein